MADIILPADQDWATCNGGTYPGDHDTIYLNGHVLHLHPLTFGFNFACQEVIGKTGPGGDWCTGGIDFVDNLYLWEGTSIHFYWNLTAGLSTPLFITGMFSPIYFHGTVTGGQASNCRGLLTDDGSHLVIDEVVGGTAAKCYGVHSAGFWDTEGYHQQLHIGTIRGGSNATAYGVFDQSGEIFCTDAYPGSLGTAIRLEESLPYNEAEMPNERWDAVARVTNVHAGAVACVSSKMGILYATNTVGDSTSIPIVSESGGIAGCNNNTFTLASVTGGSTPALSMAAGTAHITNATGGGTTDVAAVTCSGGFTEIDVAKGGSVLGAPAVNITASAATVLVNSIDRTGVAQPVGLGNLNIARTGYLQFFDENGNKLPMYPTTVKLLGVKAK